MIKNFWKWVVAILSGVGAALLFLLKRKPTVDSALPQHDDNLVNKIAEIQAKTDEQIIDAATPKQKEIINSVVTSNVAAALDAAKKYRRKKSI